MRFPWLQVDADFIGAHAGDLGAHLGISRREAMGLALDLWTWALARAGDDAPPDGLVTGTGPVPDRLLAGSVGWTGPAEEFSAALLSVGMAVRVDGGYRLTGFGRYKATWEKNRRRSGAKPDRNRTGTGKEPARKTQTQTQKKKEDPPNPPRGEGIGEQVCEWESTAPADTLPFEAQPPAVSEESLPDAIQRVHQERRGRPYVWTSEDSTAADRLLSWAMQGGCSAAEAVGEVARRWGYALDAEREAFAPGRRKANLLRELVRPSCWAANAEPYKAAEKVQPSTASNPGRGGAKATCAGCGRPDECGQVGEVLLGYGCGCLSAWGAAGVDYTAVVDWARERRAGRGA